MSAEDLGFALARPFPQALETLEKICKLPSRHRNDTCSPRKALALVQALSPTAEHWYRPRART